MLMLYGRTNTPDRRQSNGVLKATICNHTRCLISNVILTSVRLSLKAFLIAAKPMWFEKGILFNLHLVTNFQI